ncbi:MAG: TonB-dependent receptor [Desulfuromonadales bacterium]|nr:TonB-dependent receptor [Desulfuromonadales bacterium]
MPNKLIYTCFLSLLLLVLLSPVQARSGSQMPEFDEIGMEELYGDEEFVSIATGSTKPVYKAPAVASVITAKEIKEMGATTLDEVLERVPGLHVGVSTQGRLDSIYSIRGIHTTFNPQVLILMNGISFPFLSGGRPFHFRLPVAAIERVEIIRGPGSAVYGADAYAGVINIITKDAKAINGTEIGARTGSFDTQDLWLQHGDQWGNWDIAFSLQWQKTNGDSDRKINSDLQSLLDPTLSNAPGPLSSRYNVLDTHLELQKDNWRLRHWYWKQHDAGLGAGVALALDPDGGESIEQHLIDLTYQTTNLLQNWDLSANINYFHIESDSRFNLLPTGTTAPIGSDGNLDLTSGNFVTFTDGLLGNPAGKGEKTGLDLVALYTGIDFHRFRFGGGFNHVSMSATRETKNYGPGVIDGTVSPIDGTLTNVAGTPNIFIKDSSRTLCYLSFQDEWQFAPDWELTAGVRYDDYSDFGNTVNPRLALVWATRHNLTTKLLYGRAFRAPSFNESFSINNPVARGNHDLAPETIDTIELALDYRPTFNLQTVITTFFYTADDLIEFVPDANGTTRTAQNERDQKGYGFEVEMIWNARKNLQIHGNYAWQHSEDSATGKRIADAPGQQAFLSASWAFLPLWSLNPQINWVADRKRAADDSREEINDYTLVHLTLHRKEIYNHWDFSLAIRNLLDEEAYEPSTATIPDDYPLEGRSCWAEISYRF